MENVISLNSTRTKLVAFAMVVVVLASAVGFGVARGYGGGGTISGPMSVGYQIPPPTPVVQQVLGAASYFFGTTLQLGSTGADVTALQKFLIAGGFLNIPSPTGTFGSLTKAAVIKYQLALKISPQSGVVGPLTRAELNKGSLPTTPETSTSGHSNLTPAQISAIISLLQSFGADQSVITSVQASL